MNATISLTQYQEKSPIEASQSLDRKATFYSALEKISWVAFAAITAFVITISVMAPPLAGALSLAMIALSFSVLLCVFGAMTFRNWANEAREQSAIEKGVSREMPGSEHNPVIARIRYLEKEFVRIREESLATLHKTEASEIRFLARDLALYDLEYKALPNLFQAALLRKALDNSLQKISLHDYGRLTQKSPARRLSDLHFTRNDSYFTPHKGAPLSFWSLLNETPQSLSEKLVK